MTDDLSDDDVSACMRVLDAIVRDRSVLAGLDQDTRRALLMLAGRASRPERAELRRLNKALRRKDRDEQRAADDALLEHTGARTARRAPVFATPRREETLELLAANRGASGDGPELHEPRKCYVCKEPYRRVHFFYDQLCPPCADLSYAKRAQTADLRGRTALVTGARIKIGYQAAMMLLRAGARVVVTTRFPNDAAQRYARESDFASFADRLAIYGLDLRHTPSVEIFARELAATEERLDFILHNACQTVRRPAAFYAHLLEAESTPAPSAARDVVRSLPSGADPVRLSQARVAPEDRALSGRLDLFPSGKLDADLQQIDLRDTNSWRMALADVPTVELIEVHLVNAIAPFVLSAKLKPLMLRQPTFDKHIVNVSAMEGQFYRDHKTDKHPHTNMAKAALNMLTRTSAADYVRDGIHMNSVDTGWITDEDPAVLASRKVEEHGFHPPLDVVDGAARICDPIFSGLATGKHAWGCFFKDYRPADW